MLSMIIASGVIWGASFTMRTAQCPIGNDQVRIYSVVSDNQLGGFDSDLASYSSGEQARQYMISTCISSYISLYGSDINRIIPEETAQQIQRNTTSLRQTFPQPDSPQIWERYLLAIEFYKTLEEPDLFIAKLYMEAIWSARDTIVGFHAGLDGPEVIDKVLAQAETELIKPLEADQRKVLMFNLARVAHRGGYSQLRDDYIQGFLILPNLTADEKSAAEQFIFVTQQVEPLLQQKLKELFTTSTLEQLNSKERAHANYILADIARRQKEPQKAIQHYQSVLLEDKAEEKIRTLANYFINKL